MLEILISSFNTFTAGINSLAWHWRLWIYLMVFTNGIMPLFFLPKVSAAIVLSASLTGFFIGLVLTHVLGYSKILGLMHLPWIPMVCFLFYLTLSKEYSLSSWYEIWILSSLIISCLSLLVDFKDIYEYLLETR